MLLVLLTALDTNPSQREQQQPQQQKQARTGRVTASCFPLLLLDLRLKAASDRLHKRPLSRLPPPPPPPAADHVTGNK